jgi:hypothetical protein
MRVFGPRQTDQDEDRRTLAQRILRSNHEAEGTGGAAPTPDIPDGAGKGHHVPVAATYDPPRPRDIAPTSHGQTGAWQAHPEPQPVTRPKSRPAARLISRPGRSETDRAATPAEAGDPGPFCAQVRQANEDVPAGHALPDGASWQAGDAPRDMPPRAPSAPRRRRMWDIDPSAPDPTRSADGFGSGPAAPRADPAPADSRPAARPSSVPNPQEVEQARAHLARLRQTESTASGTPASGDGPAARARTRVLGFHGREMATNDPLARHSAATQAGPPCPVGWIVVIAGPGRGASFTLVAGVSSIGRGSDQAIALDFGDLAISRDNHASIAYDDREDRFLLGHGGKANLVRLNGRPVVSTEDLSDGDEIAIGDTVLRFVGFCGAGFRWTDTPDAPGGASGHRASDYDSGKVEG